MRPQASGEVVWRPPREVARVSHLERFIGGQGLSSLEHLHARASADPAWFWGAAAEELGIRWSRPFRTVLDLSGGPWAPRWFPGGALNIVDTCLGLQLDRGRADEPALIWEGEPGEVRRLTYGDLAAEVSRLAAALAALGVEPGDHVGLFLPTIPEAVVAALACARICAPFVPADARITPEALASALNDTKAKVLICADGFHLGGAVVPTKELADEALDRCPSVRRVIVHRRVVREIPWRHGRDLVWEQLLEDAPAPAPALEGRPDTPLVVLHPAAAAVSELTVHVHAGLPVKAAQELGHVFDLGPGDLVFWPRLGAGGVEPWLTFGALARGAAVLICEGALDAPDPCRTWRLAAEHGVTHLGVSSRLVRTLMSGEAACAAHHDLSRLRILCGPGAGWDPRTWLWFFEQVGGGTRPLLLGWGRAEDSGSILSGNLLTPMRPGSFAGPAPGVAADVVDAAGASLGGGTGEVVVRAPWPGMGAALDEQGRKRLAHRWDRFPGAWGRGDTVSVDSRDRLWYLAEGLDAQADRGGAAC
ncbi:MAG: AMP-binding protein [Candidatus Dormibacterales bacterium]